MRVKSNGESDYVKFNNGKCNHYEKRNLWQVLLMAKEIMASVLMPIVIMAIVIMAMYLWQKYHDKCY